MTITGQHVQTATVLVVDDEPALRQLIALAVARAGARPVLASDVPEALELVEREPVHLVLTDLTMPGLGGLDLLAALSARRCTIPAVVVTGSNDTSTLRACRLLGAQVVAKPFGLEELARLVSHELGRECLAA
ncbi:MAG TPA: response regulator [Gaiellaceae bacterium]|nr:response regulator [Gaiellaceae bacterium]